VAIPPNLYGNWVIANVFDSIAYTDTNMLKRTSNINVGQYGITEIIIQKQFADSILFINEDLENSFSKVISFKNNTIVTDDSLIITFDKTTGYFSLKINENLVKNYYAKAPENMLISDSGFVNLNCKFAFRKMYNANFNKYSYLIKDTLQNDEEKKFTTFFADGKVKGYRNYTHYYLHLNGDLNNVENAMHLSMYDYNKNESSFGLKYYSDSIELYSLKITSLAGEKPSYIATNKLVTLIKQKWF